MKQNILSKDEIEWAYSKWCEGCTYQQIAEALFVCEKTIERALKGRPRIRPVLVYDFKKEREQK